MPEKTCMVSFKFVTVNIFRVNINDIVINSESVLWDNMSSHSDVYAMYNRQ